MDVEFKRKMEWGDDRRIYNDDSLKINLEGFPSLQLTFYHTKRKLMLNVVPKRWRHMYKLDVSTYNGRFEK